MSLRAGPALARSACALVVGTFAFFCAWFTGFYPPFSNPNELSRFETVVAFVETGSFAIDSQLSTLGDHEDKAAAGGHFYSNKAPGLALAAIPVYRVLRLALPAPDSPTAPVLGLLRLFTVSLVSVLALARFARRMLLSRDGETGAAVVTFAVAFGTPFLYYARSFFAHAWTASLLFLAWDLVRDPATAGREARRRWALAAAGLLAGWALISEYTVAPVVLALAVRSAVSTPGRRSGVEVLSFAAGAALPIAILLAYQAACFGSPFLPSYAREAYPAYAELARRRFLGFGPPSVKIALAYLFHPARGILLFSPFFLWAGVGAARWCRDRRQRVDGVFASAATVVTFLLLTGYANWHGGWALGSRYLLPLLFLPAAALPFALATPLSRGLFAAAAVFSGGAHLLTTLSWPNFPLDLWFPPANGSLWFLARGWIAPNLATSAGLPPVVSVGLPLAIALFAIRVAVAAARPLEPGAPVAVLLGVGALAVMLSRPPALSYAAELLRAAIYGDYSGRDPDRRELKRVVDAASTEVEKRQAAIAWSSSGPR
jgi:hypothetical protein